MMAACNEIESPVAGDNATGDNAADGKTGSDPIRVVHVVPNLSTGGMERLVVEMLKHADRQQFVPHVLCIGQRGELAREADELGISVTALEAPLRRNPRLPFKIARYLRSINADVIHTHGPYAQFYGGLAAYIAGGLPVVHTMHGFPWPRTVRRRLLSRISNALTRFIVPVSHDLAKYARCELKAPAKRVRVVHNGIDSSHFDAAVVSLSAPRYSSLMVARLSSEKDFASLIAAVDVIRQKHHEFRLAIAGEGPQRADIERQIDHLQLRRHIELLGNRSDIPDLLSRSETFVLSTHTEGISIALLESMACGLPVVATAVGGNPEVLADGETGFLVPPGNPEALADRLLWLINHPQEARAMGAAGRLRVEEKFNIRVMAATYERLYRHCPRRNAIDDRFAKRKAVSTAEGQATPR